MNLSQTLNTLLTSVARPPSIEQPLSRHAFSIDEVAVSIGVGRDKVYDEIRAGRLTAKRAGRRTIITADALRDYLEQLPNLQLPPST